MSKELPLEKTYQERTLNKAVSDVLKASMVGMLAVLITAIPFEQFGMVVPSMGELFAITQFRSLVYILVTLPFIIFWNSSKRNLFLYMALILIIQYPLLGDGLAYFWPGKYRLTDGIVLSLQVCIMSWLYVTLLWKGKVSENGSAVEEKDKSPVTT